MKIIHLALLVFLLIGCQTIKIEKRLYRPGYSFSWRKKIQRTENKTTIFSHELTEQKIEPFIDQAENTALIAKQVEADSAANKGLNTLMKLSLNSVSDTHLTNSSAPIVENRHSSQTRENQYSFEKTTLSKSSSELEEPVVNDPRILPTWLIVTLCVLFGVTLLCSIYMVCGLSLFIYVVEDQLLLAILSGTILGYLVFFLGFLGFYSLFKRESQRKMSFAKKAALWGLFGISLGVLWGILLVVLFATFTL